jgi:hypothetical protein
MSFRKRTGALAATIAALTLLFAPAAAQAEEAASPMQQHIDGVIAEFGGEQTGWNEVTWHEEGTMLTVSPSDVVPGSSMSFSLEPFAVGNCPSGKHCVYSGINRGGSRYDFGTCAKDQSVSPLGSAVKSIANSRSSQTVKAYNGSTLVTTVSANTGKNVSSTVTKVSCS